MGTPTNEIVEKLKTFGAMQGVGAFHMMTRLRQSNLSDEEKEKVKKGYCDGVCVDWIRRVVQGGRATMDKPERLNSQVHRQVLLHVHTKTRHATYAGYNDALCDLMDVYNAEGQSGDVNISGALLEKLRNSLPPGTLAPGQTAGPVKTATAGEWFELLQAIQDKSNRSTPTGWKEFAHHVDNVAILKRARKAQDSSRPLSGLQILDAQDYVENGASSKEALDRQLKNAAFTDNTALLLTFEIKEEGGRNTGHAVAVYRKQAGVYLLFDPNYGVFECSPENVLGALIYLFGPPKPIYGEDGDTVTGDLGFILLGKLQ